MSNEHNIDKLLKESFDNFSPEAPDVWQAVQQGVQAAQASAAASSGAGAAVVQGVGLTVKIVAGIAIAAASVTGYLLYKTQDGLDAVKTPAPVVNEQVVVQPRVPVQNNQPVEAEIVTPEVKADKTHVIKHPVSEKPEGKQRQKTVAENLTAEASAQENKMLSSESVKRGESGETQPAEEATLIETLKSITNASSSEKVTGNVSPEGGKTISEKPYNPYTEDGEVYDKPTIPNVITPNDDGLNDKFEVLIENETYYSLKIMNAKGEMVFESRSKTQLWDGKHYKTGQPCPIGNYVYILNYQYKGSEKVHAKKGLIGLFL